MKQNRQVKILIKILFCKYLPQLSQVPVVTQDELVEVPLQVPEELQQVKNLVQEKIKVLMIKLVQNNNHP